MKDIRLQEVFALFYRLFLAFFFYQIARFLFWFFNRELIQIDSVSDYFSISYHGTAFDTTAILYVNSLFILLSLLPLIINTKRNYQKFLFYLYFITNGIAYGMNFGDFIYYRFSQARLTTAAARRSRGVLIASRGWVRKRGPGRAGRRPRGRARGRR